MSFLSPLFLRKTLSFNFTKLINLFLRLGGLGSRFIFVVFIGKFLPEYDIGVYGIISSAIILFYMFIGMDFYIFVAREIVSKDKTEHVNYFGNQLYLYGFIYLISIPIIFIFFWQGFIPIEYALYFYLLLVLEHFGQEFFRLFVTLERPLFANWILFIRQGVWVFIFIILGFLNDEFITLDNVFILWIISAVLANLISFVKVQRIYKINRFPKLDVKLIKRGLQLASWFFISTILYKFVEFSSRFFLDYYLDKEAVGVFVILTQFSNLINVIVFTMVIMYLYPKFLKAGRVKDKVQFHKIKNEMISQVVKYSIIISVLLVIGIKPVLWLVGKESLMDNYNLFYILILANVFLNFSLVWHYALYSLGNIKAVFYSTALGALLNVILNIIFIYSFGLLGAGLATMFSFGFILLLKYGFYKKLNY
jgi:O-antigen/teichoic acid export membrane protein